MAQAWSSLAEGGTIHLVGYSSGQETTFPSGALFGFGEPRSIATYGDMTVQFVRAWLARHPQEQSGSWLGAMRDPVVRDALGCVHAQPGHPWTTETLAAATSVSRATLSRRFRSALGQTPGAYVTQWRIDLASVRLRDTDEPVESISGAVGYGSPHAFSRAFRRVRGTAPGEYRSRLRK